MFWGNDQNYDITFINLPMTIISLFICTFLIYFAIKNAYSNNKSLRRRNVYATEIDLHIHECDSLELLAGIRH